MLITVIYNGIKILFTWFNDLMKIDQQLMQKGAKVQIFDQTRGIPYKKHKDQ